MNLDLEKSLQSILKDDRRGDNPIPDSLRFSYFLPYKDRLFKEIKEEFNRNNYSVKPLLQIDVPKSNFTIRPMARPEIKDWIIYQALVDYLISIIVRKVSRRSYSILNFKNKGSIDGWYLFDEKSRELYEKGFRYAVITDITGYFENIDLNELRNKLINYTNGNLDNKKIVDFLHNKFLLPWSSVRINGFGLPQGPAASSFLGDIYLDNIDREMEKRRGYIRYMDDIRIFCKSEIEAKKALIDIVKTLRNYKLNINSKKTKILINNQIENLLFDPKKTILNTIQNALSSKEIEIINSIIPLLIDDIFVAGFSDSFFSDRYLRFSLFRLSVLKESGIKFNDNKVINLILANFKNKPHHAYNFCNFLSLYDQNLKISDFFIKFLKSRENIYEWQELHILRTLLEINLRLNKREINIFFNRFKDRNRHWANRSLYALLIGRCGKPADRELISDEFNLVEDCELKKNILLSIQQLGIASRNSFYKKNRDKVYPSFFVDYIKNLNKPIYFKTSERVKITTIEELEDKFY